jgi:signal transduction histidine kinase
MNYVIKSERHVTIMAKITPPLSKLKSLNMNAPTAASHVVIPFDSQPSRFAPALAREVRNPLTSINLSIDMLRSSIMDSELKIFVDIIGRSSMRINHLVDELLKYQEIEGPEMS